MIQALKAYMFLIQTAPRLVSCHLIQDVDDPNALNYIENLLTAKDLDCQIRSIHYTRLLELMEEAAEPPKLRLNWAGDVKGRDYLESVRM